MARIWVVYGTRDGHTRKIVDFIAAHAQRLGHTIDVVEVPAVGPSAALSVPATAPEAMIVAAPVYVGRHPDAIRDFVGRHLAMIDELPSAFVSVSLAATDTKSFDALGQIDAFCEITGWRPMLAKPVAGALAYSQYGAAKRLLMRVIARRKRLPTDTRRDYEFTDWDDLRHFIADFLHRVRRDSLRRVASRSA